MTVGGAFVGIPLTLFQTATLHGTLGHLPGWTDIAGLLTLNACMGHAVYDRDRARDATPDITSTSVDSTSAATVLGTLALGTHGVETSMLAPVLVALHLYYYDAKVWIAPIKPVFVAVMWLVATYYLPHWYLHVSSPPDDSANVMADFAQICAWSNVADLDDVDEDLARGLRTPATQIDASVLVALSYALLCLSVACHSQRGPVPIDQVVDGTSLMLMTAFAWNRTQS